MAVRRLMESSEHIVLLGHTGPDGDAMGSTLAMWHVLKQMGKDAQVVYPDAYPGFFRWMPGVGESTVYKSMKEKVREIIEKADLLLCLDFNTPSRAGQIEEDIERSGARKMLLDHHLYPTKDWTLCISVPEASSTCELVYRLLVTAGMEDRLTRDVARCIYTGMMTDTGNFTYSCNDKELYYIIADLMERGIDKEQIYRDVNCNNCESRLRLTGYLLSEKMRLYPETGAAITSLSLTEKQTYKYQKGDTEGYVNKPMEIEGIFVSAFVSEDADKIKVSLRSQGDFAVNEIAEDLFGGGGHKNAAGGESYTETLEEVVSRLEAALPSYVESYRKQETEKNIFKIKK